MLDRVRHVLDGDLEIAFCDLLGRTHVPGLCGELHRERRELRARRVAVERQIAGCAENLREQLRIDLADHDIAVGHGQGATASVRGRPRVRARRLRTDAEARAIEDADRAASRRDRVNLHHRRPQAHARDLGDERALVLSGVMRDVGGGTAHVEADDLVEAGELRDLHRPDDAAGRAGQDCVLALEAVRVGQSARRLHELQTDARKLRLDVDHVAAQDRRQIRVDDRGIAARDELHQRAHLVANRNLREADRTRERGETALVLRIAVAVHEDDRAGANPVRVRCAQVDLGAGKVELAHDFAAGSDALVDLDYALVDRLRKNDFAHEELGPVLVSNAQRILEAAGDREHGALALALEQCIRGDRRAHFYRFDLRGRNRGAGSHAEQLADSGNGRIAVALGILGEQLVRQQGSVRSPRDDVGERAATINPELPAARLRVGHDLKGKTARYERCVRQTGTRPYYSGAGRLAAGRPSVVQMRRSRPGLRP